MTRRFTICFNWWPDRCILQRCSSIFMHNPKRHVNDTVQCTRARGLRPRGRRRKNSMHAYLQMKCKHGIRKFKWSALSMGGWVVGKCTEVSFELVKPSKCLVMKFGHFFDGWTLDHWTHHWTFRAISLWTCELSWFSTTSTLHRHTYVRRRMFSNRWNSSSDVRFCFVRLRLCRWFGVFRR